MSIATRSDPWDPSANSSSNGLSTALRAAAPDFAKARQYSPIGAVGGMFGGLLGIGGGSAIAPLLLAFGSLKPSQVAGTTLASVLVISAVGSVAYASLGHIDLGLALPIAAGSVAGSVGGALMARRLSLRLMLGLFILLLPYFAIKEFFPALAAPALAANTISLVLLGFFTGVLSGLLGIGGASLIVPSLVAFFLLDHIAAQGIAMTVALADSAAGVATHARSKNINYGVLLYIAPVALVAAIAGALVSHQLSEPVLRNLFGAFTVAIWLILSIRWIGVTLRQRRRSSTRHR